MQHPTQNRSTNYQPSRYTHPCPWDNCDRLFTCPHNVQQHIREKHTAEKPYKCTKCPAAFARPFVRNRHMKKVHEVDAGPGRGWKRKAETFDESEESSDVVAGAAGESQYDSRPEFGQFLGADDVFENTDAVRETVATAGPPAKKRKVESTEEASSSYVADPDYSAQAPTQDPESPPQAGGEPFILENFIPKPSPCDQCPAILDMREAFLAHLHDEHGLPGRASCDCMRCLDVDHEVVTTTVDPKVSGLEFDGMPLELAEAPAEEIGTLSSFAATASYLPTMDLGKDTAHELFSMSPAVRNESRSEPALDQSEKHESYFDYYPAGQFDNLDVMGTDDGAAEWLKEAAEVFDHEGDEQG